MEHQSKKKRKLNREDHKGEERVAEGIKGVAIGVAVGTTIAVFVKKNGVKALKNIPAAAVKNFLRRF